MRKMRILMLAGFLSLSLGASGCQVGRMITSVNRERKIPTLDVSVLPKQWEPKVEEEDSRPSDVAMKEE